MLHFVGDLVVLNGFQTFEMLGFILNMHNSRRSRFIFLNPHQTLKTRLDSQPMSLFFGLRNSDHASD